MSVRSVRAVWCLVVLSIFGLYAWGVPVAEQLTEMTVGDFHFVDPANPPPEMQLVFYPRVGFASCDISVTVCRVEDSLTGCRSRSESLTAVDFLTVASLTPELGLTTEPLPVLTKTTLLPMPEPGGGPNQPGEELWFVGVEFDTGDACLPGFSLVPSGQSSWYVAGPPEGASALSGLNLARIEEVLIGGPVTEDMSLPCASVHIKVQGGPGWP